MNSLTSTLRKRTNLLNSFSSFRYYNQNIDATKIHYDLTKTPKEKTPYDQLVFGRTFTDHMLEIDWDSSKGWMSPQIHPYRDLQISPAATGLHYAIQCFEGMKAYKDKNGKALLFRPEKNMERMNNSMTRLAMPPIDGNNGFLECIKALIKVDDSWIPNKEGYSLYIRPTAIGTSSILGVHASDHVKLFVILSPVGPYYKSGFKPIRLFADTKNVRAWPGGVGNTKVGGNYGPTIYPSQVAAKEHGCAQILWLYGPEHHVTEVGAMNIFFVFKKDNGKVELATAPLTRGDILPGVTRASILELARSFPDIEVNERFISMKEIVKAEKEGKLLEAFGAGTAAVVSPVKGIVYDDHEIKVPTGEDAGPMAMKFWNLLKDIQYGNVKHPWAVPV